MKVLMFGWEFPPNISGGLGTACKGLTKHLTQQGVNILFVMPRIHGHIPPVHRMEIKAAENFMVNLTHQTFSEELTDETIQFLEVDCLLQPYQDEYAYQQKLTEKIEQIRQEDTGESFEGTLAFSGSYGDSLLAEVSRYALVGAQMAEEEEFDIIHAHDWMTYLAAIEAKRVSGKPLVCHIHATEYDRSGDAINKDVFELEKLGFESADLVIAVSQRCKDILISKYKIPAKKIAVVHNAVSKEKQVERSEIKRVSNDKVVLFLGRVTMQKGPEYFVEAARKVLDKMDNVRFVMAGSGDMLPGMIERIAKYRMQKNFHFTGFLNGREVEEMFAQSDIYVMPSVSEPFGITPFEAMLYHVPIIISKQSGISEVLSHAIKVDFWDIDKLADSILSVLEDDEYAAELAGIGEQALEKVSWDVAAHKVIQLYKDLD